MLLESDAGVPLAAANRLLDRELRLELKFDGAADLPLDSPREKQRFLEFYHRMQLDHERLALDRERFAFRCEEIRHRRRTAEELRERQAAERELRHQHQEQLRRDRRRAEREAAQARAALSPLAQVRWRAPAGNAAETAAPVNATAIRHPGGLNAGDQLQAAERLWTADREHHEDWSELENAAA